MNNRIIIAIDFDGTIAKHRFPLIGEPVPEAFDYCRQFTDEGASLILWTMRCYEGSLGDVLTPAVEFCRKHGVEFWGVNENPQQTETRWSTSSKVYAHCYIDDSAAGTPLLRDTYSGVHEHCRDQAHLPYVNWSLIGPRVLSVIKMLK